MRLITIGFVILFIAFGNNTLTAQSNIVISEHPDITSMMIRMVDINRSREGIEGWRIQILATTDRRQMEEARTAFMSKYPGVKIDWMHEKPYYKIRVGAFTHKLEAMRLLYRLKRDYPSAYPAKDNNINPAELVGLDGQ